MEAAFWRMLTTAGVVSAFLAVLLPARRWLTNRYAPQVRWGLWRGLGLVLILGIFASGFAALPATSWHLPGYSVTIPAVTEPPAQPESESTAEPAAPAPSGDPKDADTQGGSVYAGEERATVPQTQASAAVTFPAASAAAAVWLAGTVGVLLWQGGRYGWARRRLLASSVSTDAYAATAREMGVKAAIRVLRGLECPVALGIFRPVVLLPEGEAADLAVRHELTHILRHDLAGRGLLFLACALYWFDPLVWAMARIAGEDMEAACDAQLVRDMTASEKRAYGELLLQAAAGGRAAPLFTRFSGSGEEMKSRLTQLFRPGKQSRALTAVLLAAAFAVTGLTACRGGGEASSDQQTEVGEDGSASVALTEGTPFAPTRAGANLADADREVTTADISLTLAHATLSDGTKVLFYISLSGEKYGAYIPAGTERVIRFTHEDNAYTDGYDVSLYENVLGKSGFCMACPRGAAYYASDYYYFDEDGALWLLAGCGSEAMEVDLNGDGEKELLWSYHESELYYDTRIGGQLYEANLGALTAEALGYGQDGTLTALEMPVSPEAFTGETGYTLTLTGEDGSPTEQLSGTVRLGADTLQVCQPTYRAVPPPEVESDGETRAAFAAVLRNLRENGILPDGRAAEGAEHGAGESNSFAVADVDGDGKEELVLYYVDTIMAGMSGYVVGYDEESGQIHIQLRDFPSMEFYGSGAVKAMLSHNQSLGELWPYILYTYLPQTDAYQEGDMVTAWDGHSHPTNYDGEPFPEEIDRSGTGTVYYVEGWYEGDPMDRADYLAWEREALEGSDRLMLDFLPLTEENIASLEGGSPDGRAW